MEKGLDPKSKREVVLAVVIVVTTVVLTIAGIYTYNTTPHVEVAFTFMLGAYVFFVLAPQPLHEKFVTSFISALLVRQKKRHQKRRLQRIRKRSKKR